MGIDTSDDAAVYRISDEIAMIQTVDFFTPIVDDPYLFGQIGAANSLSDVYAMGGVPKVALNIVGFPNCLDPQILGEILAGGASKVMEAGAVLVGGHSVQNDEPQYGLCVSGFVHPDRIWKNYGAQPGDVLILTKPVGNGLVNTAFKADMVSKASYAEAVEGMRSLNKTAAEVLLKYEVHACTDITGFGLGGHCLEMAEGSDVTLQLNVKRIPYITGAEEYAKMGLVPAGSYRNRGYSRGKLDARGIPDHYIDLIYDPQTSGGLLASVRGEDAPAIMRDLIAAGLPTRAAVIGSVLARGEYRIVLSEQ